MLSIPPAAAAKTVDNAIVLYVDSGTALVNNRERLIDEDARVMPVVENARALVPVRFIAEGFGMSVDYNEQLRLVTITGGGRSICYTIGSNIMSADGIEGLIDPENPDVTAKTLNERTLIPLRSFAQSIGKEVFYDRGLIIISDNANSFDAKEDKGFIDSLIEKVNILPVVGSADNLEKLLDRYGLETRMYIRGTGAAEPNIDIDFESPTQSARALDSIKAEEAKTEGGAGYSETNVQVAGVDEADIVKTDGDYLYHVSGQKIMITKINPVSQMSVTSVIERNDEEFYPYEVYIDNDRLVVIAQVSRWEKPRVYDSAKQIMPISDERIRSGVQCSVYNIANRANPVLERVFEVEGNYLSSRKIDNIVYLVANKYLNRYIAPEESPVIYRDNQTEHKIGYDGIRYFPGFSAVNYLIVSSIDITQPDKAANLQTLLGGGENIYVSRENMYVAASEYGSANLKMGIYKFSLTDGKITYLKKGEVRGRILNQFSMDEHDGYFRIATTSYEGGEQNNLFILDDTLTPCGGIEEIAPGERIYSVRFMGEKGYMVTFKQVDPLFVIDLADPYNPRILGNLKIPGYSDYIHPVDENHIIGFGKDATENGLYQGMKMALFDVSDVSSPKQKFQEIIGDRGTESALLQNHKALLYAPGLNILSFPVTVREVLENDTYKTAYGQLTFSCAYVYSFDADSGFALKGKISHLTNEDMLKLGNYVPQEKEIKRIVYSGESLITVSDSKVQAHSITDVEFQNGIEIKN